VEQGYHTDGCRDNSFVNNYDSFNKVTMQLGDGTLSIRAQAYGTTFGAPGYINRDAVSSVFFLPAPPSIRPMAAINSSRI
jgi:hypothetical protein